MVHRSSRIPADLSLNRLAEARKKIGEIAFDLTVSNPTSCGIPYPPELLGPLADPRGLVFDPDPRGPLTTRKAVATEYLRWGAELDPELDVAATSASHALFESI